MRSGKSALLIEKYMNPYTKALLRDETYNVAVDVDLTALDTLTPWLSLYGLDVQDVKPIDGDCWGDIAEVIKRKAIIKEGESIGDPIDYWRDPKTYEKCQPMAGFYEFLKSLEDSLYRETGKYVRFFWCSTCIASHKDAKVKRLKELFGEDMVAGFVDTSCKHLVDFDLLIDDSPKQVLAALETGKSALLAPSPSNNKGVVRKMYVEMASRPTQSRVGKLVILESLVTKSSEDIYEVHQDLGYGEYFKLYQDNLFETNVTNTNVIVGELF